MPAKLGDYSNRRRCCELHHLFRLIAGNLACTTIPSSTCPIGASVLSFGTCHAIVRNSLRLEGLIMATANFRKVGGLTRRRFLAVCGASAAVSGFGGQAKGPFHQECAH